MTLQEAKTIARHLGLTLRKVRYTDNLEDAINSAVEMARRRALSVDATKSACARRTEP